MYNVESSIRQKLDPKILIVFFAKNIFGTLYILPIWWIGINIFERVGSQYLEYLPKEPILLLLNSAGIIYLILLILCCYYWAWLTFSRYSYTLENDGLHIYFGVLIPRHTHIPYNYIQDVQVNVNPFVVRFLGLYYLNIKTRYVANTAGAIHYPLDTRMPGMSLETLNNLRSKLILFSHTLDLNQKEYFDPTSGRYH